MKNIFVLVLLIATSCWAQTETTTDNPTDSTTVQTTVPTTETSTSTEVPTTTPATTTQSPKPPTTTTSSTTSTTAVPTTAPPSPSPTTIPPSPSPTTVPTPSTTKTPIPVPKEGYWNVTSNDTTCIRARMRILFTITIGGKEEYILLQPNASDADSSCDLSENTQELVLRDNDYSVSFIFEKDSSNVYVRNISFTYNIPGGRGTVNNNTRLFSVKNGNSYLCMSTDNVILENVTMTIYYLKLQAFGPKGDKDFGSVEECSADNKVDDIVPIAVGVALLALVVVVLIAYLVGRRRSRQKGYQSV